MNKEEFPILKEITYLDSAATTQKPQIVIDAIKEFYEEKNANIARGVYKLAEIATEEYEKSRSAVAKFMNCEPENIVFTKNTTEALNIVAQGIKINKGDKIVTTVLEHHSNYVPWLYIAKKKGAKIEVVGIDDKGNLDLADFDKKIKDAKVFALTAASNVLGTMPEYVELCKDAKNEGATTVLDAAQYITTKRITLEPDYIAFSGHKMCGPFGIGVLYGKELDNLKPLLYGSEMVLDVEKEIWAEPPQKFESGTPNPAAAYGFRKAIEYLETIGLEKIDNHCEKLTTYLFDRLNDVVNILGPEKRTHLVSFTIDGIHPHDVAAILDSKNICVRSGHHCASIIHKKLGINASTRASIYLYNEKEDVDRLIEGIEKVKRIFGG